MCFENYVLTMTGAINGAESQATLGVCRSQDSTASVRRRATRNRCQSLAIRDEQTLSWGLAEALSPVPGHVLNRGQRSVREKQVIVPPVADEHVVRGLDYSRKGTKGTRGGAIASGEDIPVADTVRGGRDVESPLDGGLVEVVVRSACLRWKSHHVP